MKLKVKRAFLLAGVRQEVGSEIDITDRGLIGTLKSADKVEEISQAKTKPGPMTVKNTGGLVAGEEKKETKD